MDEETIKYVCGIAKIYYEGLKHRNSSIECDDLYSAAILGAYEAQRLYDGSIPFKNYAAIYAKRNIIEYLNGQFTRGFYFKARDRDRKLGSEKFSLLINATKEHSDPLEWDGFWNFLKANLNEKQYEAIFLRFHEGLGPTDIAPIVGAKSKQAVDERIKSAFKILKNLLHEYK